MVNCCCPWRSRAARTTSPLPKPMAALASKPSNVAAKICRNGGGSVSATRHRAAFNGRNAIRFSAIEAATAQGACAARWIVHGFSRHSTAASSSNGRLRSAIFQRGERDPVTRDPACRRRSRWRAGDR